jgi:hypothetical protein
LAHELRAASAASPQRTEARDAAIVCHPGYSKSARHTSGKLKAAIYREYHLDRAGMNPNRALLASTLVVRPVTSGFPLRYACTTRFITCRPPPSIDMSGRPRCLSSLIHIIDVLVAFEQVGSHLGKGAPA